MRTSERYCCWTGCRRWARSPPRPALPAKHAPRLAACACLLGGGPLDGPAASAPASASLLSPPVSCGRHCDLNQWRAGALLLACGAGSGYCVFGLARATYAACFPPVRPRARPRRRRHAAPSLAERRRARAQLLYWTFLAEALPAGGSEPGLDALYYSEMHEAGYFDAGDDLG